MSSHTTGRGRSPRTRLDKDGFPRACLTQPKRHGGFLTGDMVKAGVTKGKKSGPYLGRLQLAPVATLPSTPCMD